MKPKLQIIMAAATMMFTAACSNARPDAAGGLPGNGFQGSDLSPQVLALSKSGDTTVYQLGPDGVHHPLANQKTPDRRK